MRIISKFKDYYDTALAHGVDKATVFNRKKAQLFKDNLGMMIRNNKECEYTFMYPSVFRGEHRDKKNHLAFAIPIKVAFCGKIYNGIKFEVEGGYKQNALTLEYGYSENKLYYVYSYEGYLDIKQRLGIVTNRKRYPWMSDNILDDNVAKLYLGAPIERHLNWFVEKKIAIMLSVKPEHNGNTIITENPCLEKIQFYKVFDAFQAFQELDMFISGVLTNEDNPMAGIDDHHLSRAKGFDGYSFKKLPTKHKPKNLP